jgi:hypothetical protein
MRARRKDANHNIVADHVQRAGFSFLDTSALGRGFPDGVAGRAGFACLVEIKDGDKCASKRKLTPAEERVRSLWTGPYVIATSPVDAVMQLMALWREGRKA